MTIIKLHRILTALIGSGFGRRSVCIDKPSFRHNLENDGCVILEVSDAQIRTVPRIDDDGGVALRADGTERTLTQLVLSGDGESSFSA